MACNRSPVSKTRADRESQAGGYMGRHRKARATRNHIGFLKNQGGADCRLKFNCSGGQRKETTGALQGSPLQLPFEGIRHLEERLAMNRATFQTPALISDSPTMASHLVKCKLKRAERPAVVQHPRWCTVGLAASSVEAEIFATNKTEAAASNFQLSLSNSPVLLPAFNDKTSIAPTSFSI